MDSAPLSGTTSSMSFLRGICADRACASLLYFPSHEASVECPSCGQRHARAALRDVVPVADVRTAVVQTLRRLLVSTGRAKKGPENVKVRGSSNYHCKLISPLLSTHGLEKSSGRARPLLELTGQPRFQCSVLAPYTFRLDLNHLGTPGYGRDTSGGATYLKDTLQAIQQVNDGEERLVPVHADGDGHCLVHAVSRALTGRELFWHPLRLNLEQHLSEHMQQYKDLFCDFIDCDDWPLIVAECDPDYVPPDGEPHGLRNIHVFGLANVLRRPIILLDSLSGLHSSGDYAALFLPALVPPEQCRSGAEGALNPPICLAWSSAGRNHYIALVPVRDRKLPRLPLSLLPKVWGVDQSLRGQYLTILDGFCTIGAEKSLQDGYIQRLTLATDHLFMEKHGFHPELVADAHLHLFKRLGIFGYSPPYVCDEVAAALAEDRLFRCLRCDAILEQRLEPAWLEAGGYLHRLASEQHGQLVDTKLYRFPLQGVICSFNVRKDRLEVKENFGIVKCPWCEGVVRHVEPDGTPRYKNGDCTRTPAAATTCGCGSKHWWDGQLYYNPPLVFPVTLRWGNKVIGDKVAWFQGESEPELNSNVYETANRLVVKHFPGVFGIETLVKQVVDQILDQTKPAAQAAAPLAADTATTSQLKAGEEEHEATKIIVVGHKTLHKEELGMSETERRIRERISQQARVQQTRSRQPPSPSPSPSPCPAPPSPQPRPDPPTGCRVRVVTSGGQQANLTLAEGTSYGQFLSQVTEALGVTRDRIRRLLHGFPPRPLTLEDADVVPFQSGDRVQVELHPAPVAAGPSPPGPAAPAPAPAREDSGESLDAAVQALVLAAQLTGADLWRQVQSLPSLFNRDGLFYRLAQRDVTLTDGKHVRLKALPGKMFYYSAASDELQLCLEPHGHHPVSADVEERVLGTSAAAAPGPSSRPPQHVVHTSGSARIATSAHLGRPQPTVHPSFTGTGHTLGGASHEGTPSGTFVRVGPGSMVLRPVTPSEQTGATDCRPEAEQIAQTAGQQSGESGDRPVRMAQPSDDLEQTGTGSARPVDQTAGPGSDSLSMEQSGDTSPGVQRMEESALSCDLPRPSSGIVPDPDSNDPPQSQDLEELPPESERSEPPQRQPAAPGKEGEEPHDPHQEMELS